MITVAVVLLLVAGTLFVVNTGGEEVNNAAVADAPTTVKDTKTTTIQNDHQTGDKRNGS